MQSRSSLLPDEWILPTSRRKMTGQFAGAEILATPLRPVFILGSLVQSGALHRLTQLPQ